MKRVRKVAFPKRVGWYRLFDMVVDLVADGTNGGSFFFSPDNVSPPRICVGVDSDWDLCVGTLLHEAMEMRFSQGGCRLERDSFYLGNDRFIFHCNHIEFSRVCEDVGRFLSSALPDLAKIYDWHSQWKKQKER